ncbi:MULTISPECIES: GNAT family N-acetyltransferase [unclassified Streptomyces]|uniref:GNAT family N-acetyltransferase n=1 Tax=unclassified Streptomyces TaxID=2593676 RepID=UPI003317DB59
MDHITIRPAGPDDTATVLALFDGAVAWLVSQGRTGQWGDKPWSANPKTIALVEKYLTTGSAWIAEIGGEAVGTVTLTDGPGDYIAAVDEPEQYVHLLASRHGSGAGAALLAHAAQETRRQGVSLLRVDCYAGDDGKLVAFYERNGFTRTDAFLAQDGTWPGQVLARRV